MLDAEAHRVFPVPVTGLPKDGLVLFVVAFGFEVEVLQAQSRGPSRGEAGQCAAHFAHVVLGVGAAVGTEREELHHLARVVLVGVLLFVVDPV